MSDDANSTGNYSFLWLLGAVITLLVMFIVTRSNSPIRAAANVNKAFPGAKIAVIGSHKWRFIVLLPDGSIHSVETLNLSNDDISADEVVFTAADIDTRWHDEAVKAGKAEYYIDEKNQKQWRWK